MSTKYEKLKVPIKKEFEVELPLGSEITTIQVVEKHAIIYALIEPESKMLERKFIIIEAGDEIPHKISCIKYLTHYKEGSKEFHLFECLDKSI